MLLRPRLRGGLDAQGNMIAYEYSARSADYNHVGYNEADTVLIAQLMSFGHSFIFLLAVFFLARIFWAFVGNHHSR